MKSKKTSEKSEDRVKEEKAAAAPVEEVVEVEKKEASPEVSEPVKENTEPEPQAAETVVDSPTPSVTQATNEVGMYEDENHESESTNNSDEEGKNEEMDEPDHSFISKIKWIIVVILILGLLLASSLLSYQFGVSQGKKSVEKEVAAEEEAPTPTPAASDEDVNLSVYTISVLNGSGIKGEASTLQKKLDAEGYNVTTIGNAEDDVVKTLIEVKDKVSKSYINKLKEELSVTYTLDTDVGELSSSNEEDVVITIGSATHEE